MSAGLGRPRLHSLRDKLTLLFFAITAAAFALLYLIVVPPLESNLRQQKLDDIVRVARGSSDVLEALTRNPNLTAPRLDQRIRALADATDTRVTLYGVQQDDQGTNSLYTVTDSREEIQVPENLELVRRAIDDGGLAAGRRRFRGGELGQVAQPILYDGQPARVALYSRTLDDVSDTVSFVRARLLAAGAVALILTLLGGAAVAQALSRRVSRLERAAEDVAAGKHIAPLPIDSEDELGQLTRAFNEMQEQLRQVDSARREFVATASHELRTPLFSLGGFVELLRDEDLDESERREFLEEIAQQVERLQRLAVALLDLSRLDAGSLALATEVVDLKEVVESVVREFTPALLEHGTKVDLKLAEPSVEASCDRERVAQILRVLLDNALRHTPRGTTVTISAGQDSAGAALTVSDAGPGLPPDTRVFDRFVTGGASQGAGLGLAIAHELAERMDGSLRASANGTGAAFTLELPAASS